MDEAPEEKRAFPRAPFVLRVEQVPISLSFPGLMDPIEISGRSELVNSGGAEVRDNKASALPPEGFRVLIVEDNPHIIEMYSYVLKKLATGPLGGKVPLEVHFAPDGHGALKQLMESRFNLVMTDLYMPVMDGFALVEKIRQEEALKGIPVIAISAGGTEAQERALGLGVDVYLRKPVKFVEVLETVKQLLRIK